MSTPRRDYFAGRAERIAALRAACEGWAGTPFRKHSRVKGAGGGVDCEWFVPSVLREAGALSEEEFTRIVIPGYEINHAEHSTVSLFHAWFRQPEAQQRVRSVDEAEPHVDGDLVFPTVGLCEHHIGIRIGQLVYHIARPSGWCAMTVGQFKLHRSRYRLIEAET